MRNRRFIGRGLAGSTVIAVALLVAACGSLPGAGSETEQAPAFSGEVPEFRGPYAAEYTQFFKSAESEFVRAALADEKITDAEYAEMTARFADCLADSGVVFEGFDPDGGMTTSLAPNGGDTHAIIGECSASSGEQAIGALYSFNRTNPDGLDSATITAECLVRSGTVPTDYSADDFSADTAGRFADLGSLEPDLQEALVACSSDPLGLLGE